MRDNGLTECFWWALRWSVRGGFAGRLPSADGQTQPPANCSQLPAFLEESRPSPFQSQASVQTHKKKEKNN